MAIKRRRARQPFRRRGPEHNINKFISAPTVRVVGEGITPGVYTIDKALEMAKEQSLDLVEIAAKADPPVCKIVDYKKFLYDKKKKEKEIKAKAQKTVVKEIRFTPHTDDHDFEFKAKHAENFLKDGAKLKVYVQFKGRAIVFKDKGFQLMEKFIDRLEEISKVEQEPKMDGRRINMFLAPLKTQKK